MKFEIQPMNGKFRVSVTYEDARPGNHWFKDLTEALWFCTTTIKTRSDDNWSINFTKGDF